jgi:hypothetical protein
MRTTLSAVLTLLTLTAALPAQPPKPPAGEQSAKSPGAVEARLSDGSVLKLTLLDEKLDLVTPYGKLAVPLSAVRRIEFATRVSADVQKRIDAAVAKLGSDDFKEREAAGAELLALGEKAYPALLKAAGSNDPEVSRRAREMADRLKEAVPAERLAVRKHDVVHTDDSKITCQIGQATLKARAMGFGEVEVKLSDLVALGGGGGAGRVVKVLPDPGSLTSMREQIGQTYYFRVTGNAGGTVYGTDQYTTDSSLATAAVHTGVLANGQTGVVKVKVVPSPAAYTATTRNGVTSNAWGMYVAAFEVSRPEEDIVVEPAPGAGPGPAGRAFRFPRK